MFTYNEGKMLKNLIYAPDGTAYDEIAMNFLKGKGFVIDSIYARRTPLYPAFLAAIYFFTNHSIVAVRFVQGIIGALSCVVIYLIGTQIFNKSVGLIAGIMSAVYYSLLQVSAYVVSETLYIFLFLIALLFIVIYYKYKKLPYILMGGIFIGLTTLCRELGIFLIPLIAIWLFWAINGSLKLRFKATLVFVPLCLMAIMPWSIRNYRIYHKFIPLTVSSGHSLYVGNNEQTIALNGGHDTLSIIAEDISVLFTPQTDDILRKRAINFMISNPKKTIELAINKFINMWQPYYSDSSKISKIVMIFSYLPIILLGLVGLVMSIRRSKIAILYLAIIIFYALLHMFTISGIRYRYPLMPLFMIYSAFIFSKFFLKIKLKIK